LTVTFGSFKEVARLVQALENAAVEPCAISLDDAADRSGSRRNKSSAWKNMLLDQRPV
jgi:hypothetical protein